MSLRYQLLLGHFIAIVLLLLVAWGAGAPLWAVGVAGLSFFLLGLLSIQWLFMRLSRTLDAFALGTQRVAAGDFAPFLVPNADSEFTPFIATFNDMITTLHSRDQQLQHYHFEQARRVRELNALAEISRNVNSSLDGRAVLRTILNETVKSFPTARKALIHLVDESNQRLVPVALSDSAAPINKTTQGLPLDHGVAARALRERRTITVNDTLRHPDFIDQGSNIRSLMVTPLVLGERVIGALSLDSERRNAFSSDMETVFRLLADRAASALENARLYAESQARVKELTKLLQFAIDLSRTRDSRALYQQMVEGAMTLLEASAGALFLTLPTAVECVYQVAASAPTSSNPLVEQDLMPAPAIFHYATTHQEPLLYDPQQAEPPDPTRAFGSALIAPLVWQGETLGLITLAGKAALSDYGQAHLGLLALFAQHGAGVLENVRLLAELQSRTEALAAVNADLSRVSRLKSEFLATMSHELRTPLNAILGFSEILVDQTFGPLNERQSRYLTNINNSGKHLLDLINDILDLSKIEAGRMELNLEPFNLESAIEEVYTIFEPLAMKKNLIVSFESQGTSPRIVADRLRLKQVFYNILSNAVKFTPNEGHIRVRSWEEPNDEGGAEICIAISDTGIGIPAEQLEQIFDVFHRVDRSYMSATEGTGLGLALVRHFVQLHNGEVYVDSAIGAGSTFTIRLPQRPVKEYHLVSGI